MTKLTDLQSLLLAHAAARDDGALTALPTSANVVPARAMIAISQLLHRGVLEEREVSGTAHHHRSDGDLRYGAFITVAGLGAIGALDGDGGAVAPVTPPVEPVPPAADAPRQTKAALVLALLGRAGGATLPELVTATGWLPHARRAHRPAQEGPRDRARAPRRHQPLSDRSPMAGVEAAKRTGRLGSRSTGHLPPLAVPPLPCHIALTAPSFFKPA